MRSRTEGPGRGICPFLGGQTRIRDPLFDPLPHVEKHLQRWLFSVTKTLGCYAQTAGAQGF